MWNKKFITLIVLSSILIIGIAIGYLRMSKMIACVDISRAFNEFEMKRELQQQYSVKLKKLQFKIDSLSLSYQASVSEPVSESSQLRLRGEISKLLEEKQQLENVDLKNSDIQIQTRLTIYLKEFAQHENFDCLLAYSESYPILYTSDGKDVTEKAIEFVNAKYQGN